MQRGNKKASDVREYLNAPRSSLARSAIKKIYLRVFVILLKHPQANVLWSGFYEISNGFGFLNFVFHLPICFTSLCQRFKPFHFSI